jgi:hypothetical protein
MCASPHLAATRNSRLAPLPKVSPSFETSLLPSATKAFAPLCPAWATNAPPSNQSRFEVEYPGGTSQSSPTFPLPDGRVPSLCDIPNACRPEKPQASTARKVSPNFECRVKRGPIPRTVSRASLNRWAKTGLPICASYRPIGGENSRMPNNKTAGETPAVSRGGEAQLLRGFARN